MVSVKRTGGRRRGDGARRGERNSHPPTHPTHTHTTSPLDTSTTCLLGYDWGAACCIARFRRAWRGARDVRGRAGATWFSRGNHVRFDVDADLGASAIAWATFTAHDPADQANSTAVNLIERESGFIVRPFTAPSATAAVGSGVDIAASGWRLDGAFDLNALAPYASVSRSLAPGVGGPLFDGPATLALHAAPADSTLMATLELGDKSGSDAVSFGGGRGGRHPVKAFVRGRVGKGEGTVPRVNNVSVGLMVEGWPFGGAF